ncbi:MAG: hypothetical protein Q8K70_04510 [Bacteroidota bacterium]|nr:hypothetical protein [Bacteroidota bacterium]
MKKLLFIALFISLISACGSAAPEIDVTEEKQRDSVDLIVKDKAQMLLDSIEKAEEMKELQGESKVTE